MNLQHYIFVLLISIQTAFSQTHIYQHFGVDEGLPSAEVYDIYQDKQGYIWFATDKGLSRYNGYEFENFTTHDGLPGNTILDFYPQKNGRVYAYEYHSQKLFYFNEVFDGFKEYKYNDVLKTQFEPNSVVKSVVFDNKEKLLLGGANICGLVEITKKGELVNRFNLKTYVHESFEDRKVNLGFQTEKEVFFSVYHNYKTDSDNFIFKSENRQTSRLDFVFLNKEIIIFIDQKLGVLSRGGKIKYCETKKNPIGIKGINKHSFFVGYYGNGAEIRDAYGNITDTFLPNKSVSDFLIDTEGSYWFSTVDDGVFYVKNPNVQILTKNHISSLVKDNNNKLYAGFNNGNIAQISKDETNVLYKGLRSRSAIVELDSALNELYGLSDNLLVNFATKKSYLFAANKLPEHSGEALLASSSYAFYKRKNDSVVVFRLDKKIQDVCQYQNEVLIGTSVGLFTKNDKRAEKHQPLAILKSRIDDIDLNKNTNTVYMATQGNGVIVYGDSIYNITKNKGLTNDIVSEVYIENDSIVWACTNSGLNRIVFKPNNTFNLTTLTKADGLLSNDIEDVEIIKDTIWVATKKGLCFFNKNLLIEKEDSKIISLSLKDVSVNRKSIYGKNIKRKYNQSNISFTLQAISHKNTDKINYSYRLKEIDTSWSTTTSRKIHFPSLSPGAYTFQAKANVYNNENDYLITYVFEILPPFWKRWWFYGICFILLSGLVYLFFKIRVLTYNKDVFRELIRLAIRHLKRKEQSYNFRSNGEDFKIPTHEILYVNSQGNYLDIITTKKTYTIRCKIGDFIDTTPDVLEYLRVHRSYIIRIDQVSSKGKNWVVINNQKIPVGETYLSELEKIHF